MNGELEVGWLMVVVKPLKLEADFVVPFDTMIEDLVQKRGFQKKSKVEPGCC